MVSEPELGAGGLLAPAGLLTAEQGGLGETWLRIAPPPHAPIEHGRASSAGLVEVGAVVGRVRAARQPAGSAGRPAGQELDDPVRQYLRAMGAVPLLTGSQEVQPALTPGPPAAPQGAGGSGREKGSGTHDR